jgi:hypothetical protein
MSYQEPVPSCFRAYGHPGELQKIIYGCCAYCKFSYSCNLKTPIERRVEVKDR